MLVYAVTAIMLIADSLHINIIHVSSSRVIADSWTTTLAFDLLAGNLDRQDAASIAGSIATKTLMFGLGCMLAALAIAMLARKRGSSTASYIVNLFQLIVGLTFLASYLREPLVSYLWFGGTYTVAAIFQYWALPRPAVRRWLRSYAVEFFLIPSASPAISRFLKRASFRKGIGSVVLGFQVFVFAYVVYALVGELAGWALLVRDDSLESSLDRFFKWVVVVFVLVLPILVLYPTLALVALFWRRPLRILLLRPFHAPEVSNTLKNIVQDSIGYLAHVYTLADPIIRQRWYIRWPVALPHLWPFHFRSKRVINARSLKRMDRQMNRAFVRNINWFASAGKLFSIPTADSMWKPCVSRLIPLADAILFDISNPSDSIGWELDQLTRDKRAEGIVFVTRKPAVEEALNFLRQKGVAAEIGVNLFAYDEQGMASVHRFTTQFAMLLTRPETPPGGG